MTKIDVFALPFQSKPDLAGCDGQSQFQPGRFGFNLPGFDGHSQNQTWQSQLQPGRFGFNLPGFDLKLVILNQMFYFRFIELFMIFYK